MGSEIRYCDRCAQLVSPGDLKSGKGIATDDLVLCVSCAQRLTAAERAGPQEPVAPVSATPVETSRPRARPEPARAAQGAQVKTFAIAVVVAALVTIPVAMLALRDRGSPAATNRVRRAPVAKSPVPSLPVTKPQISPPTPPGVPAAATGQEPPAGDAALVADPSDLVKLKTTTAPPEVKDLAEKLKSKIAAAEKQAAELAARSAREALAAALAEFDELLAAGDYDAARERATGAAEALEKENNESKESRRVLLAAAELAGIFPERQRALRQKFVDLVGTRIDIGTRQRARRGVTLREVSDTVLTSTSAGLT